MVGFKKHCYSFQLYYTVKILFLLQDYRHFTNTNLVKGGCLSISALQEAAVGMFALEVREVFWDPHIKPIQSGQNKFWPGKGHK